jgi:hypothetical protein
VRRPSRYVELMKISARFGCLAVMRATSKANKTLLPLALGASLCRTNSRQDNFAFDGQLASPDDRCDASSSRSRIESRATASSYGGFAPSVPSVVIKEKK